MEKLKELLKLFPNSSRIIIGVDKEDFFEPPKLTNSHEASFDNNEKPELDARVFHYAGKSIFFLEGNGLIKKLDPTTRKLGI